MVKKRAQAAMEFLMEYGWAILVVIIVIGALAGFGVLSPGKFLPEKCVLPPNSGLLCEDHGVYTDGGSEEIQLLIHNTLKEQVTISSVSVSSKDKICSTSSETIIEKDSTKTITLDNDGAGCDISQKGKIKGEIRVVYNVGDEGLSKTTTGQLVTKVV